jgi:hypothetical protein
MLPVECFVRREDAYLVVVLEPELDQRWGSPEHADWVNSAADPQADQPILLQPTQEPDSMRVQRSDLETLVVVTPHAPLYDFLTDRGVPGVYHGQIDSEGRLELSRPPSDRG